MRRREFLGFAGAAVVWPLRAGAQSATYRVGFLTLEPGEIAALLTKPLGDLGYIEGKNLSVEHRSAGGDPARLAGLAEELARTKPNVLVAGWGTLAPKALKAVTSTIPIVFSTVGDPTGAGLVQSLARPGGNVTGLSGQATELKGKQLQLLLTCAPNQRTVGVLMNPDTPYTALALKQLQAAAEQQGVRLEPLEVRKPADFTAARMNALVAAGSTSLFVMEDPLTSTLRDTVIAETNRLRLPVISGLLDYVRAGALMSYGAGEADRYRQTAQYVDKILKGASPADLPVEQPTRFQLVVNLTTAKALGLTMPPSVLALADEVIE
jgi:putative ABC transport system substrate-binding protein